MGLKILYKFHDQLGGFSDYWIDNQATISNPPGGALLRSYLNTRLGLSGIQTTWDYLRLSSFNTNPPTPRQVITYYPSDAAFSAVTITGSFIQSGRLSTQLPDDSDYKGTAFNMRKFSSDSFSGRLFFRGIPDSCVITGGLINRTANFEQALSAFQATIVNNHWGWIGLAKTAGAPWLITAVVQNADGTITITTGGTPFQGLTAPAHVQARISGQGIPANINGQMTLQVLTPNTAQSIRPIGIRPFVQGSGKLFTYTQIFHPLARLTVVGATQRKAGRPFGDSPGRSRNRVRG